MLNSCFQSWDEWIWGNWTAKKDAGTNFSVGSLQDFRKPQNGAYEVSQWGERPGND